MYFLYSTLSCPLDRSEHFTHFAPPPGRHVHSDTNSASPGSILILVNAAITRED